MDVRRAADRFKLNLYIVNKNPGLSYSRQSGMTLMVKMNNGAHISAELLCVCPDSD